MVPDDTNDVNDVFVHHYTEFVAPDGYVATRGQLVSGSLGSLVNSDDDRLIYRPGIVFSMAQAPISIIVTGDSPVLNPQQISAVVEASASSPSIQQSVAIYDFLAEEFVVMDTRASTVIDAVVSVGTATNPGRFVAVNGEMRIRLEYKATGPVFVYPWQSRVDQIRWIVR
jgi:hypothetical protein